MASSLQAGLSHPPGLLDRIGNTPVVPVSGLGGVRDGVVVLGKAEWFNPGGSVKDRAAWAMVRDGMERGAFTPGRRLMDATSGNTGIAYAWPASEPRPPWWGPRAGCASFSRSSTRSRCSRTRPTHALEGLKHLATAMVPAIYDSAAHRGTEEVASEAAIEMVERQARRGLLVGWSARAALVAAERVAQRLERGVVVAILPDSGERYLGEPLWERGLREPAP